MSVRVMSWVFEHSRSTLADRLVLLAIADHANHDGLDAFPSVDTIARKARVSRATVQRSLARLVELKELEVEHGSGRGHMSRYRVLTKGPQIEALPLERASSAQQKGLIHENHASFIKPSLTAREAIPVDKYRAHVAAAKDALKRRAQ